MKRHSKTLARDSNVFTKLKRHVINFDVNFTSHRRVDTGVKEQSKNLRKVEVRCAELN